MKTVFVKNEGYALYEETDEILTVYELLPAFLLSTAVIFAVSKFTKAPSEEIIAEFDTVNSVE